VIARRARLAAGLAFLLASVVAADAAEVKMLFPTDRLTQADPAQLTGRRVRLALVNCREAPSTCDEINLLNGLDGWSVNPRMTLAFSGPVKLDSITRSSAFVLPLGDDRAEPVGLSRLVWDAEGRTLYARPERVLRQGRTYALVVTSRVLDDARQPLRRVRGATHDVRLVKRLSALGLTGDDVVASAVFTTRSVTAGLEQIRTVIEAQPASPADFIQAPGGARSVFPRAALESIVFIRQIGTGGAERFAKPVPLELDLVPPADVGTIALGSFESASFLTGSRHIPRAPSSRAPAILGHERVQAVFFLPRGPMPAPGWPARHRLRSRLR